MVHVSQLELSKCNWNVKLQLFSLYYWFNKKWSGISCGRFISNITVIFSSTVLKDENDMSRINKLPKLMLRLSAERQTNLKNNFLSSRMNYFKMYTSH